MKLGWKVQIRRVAMARFDDYHRTVIGYHGTGLSTALRIVNRFQTFRASERKYDWLGSGIYFWEYAPSQALDFARIRQRQYLRKKNKTKDDLLRASEPLAVVASMIRLGYCLDLTEPENIRYMEAVFRDYSESMALTGDALPKNTRKYRKLDRDIFEYTYKQLESVEPKRIVDTARGIYVPTDGAKRVWPASWISKDTHIQLCVRNPASILGTWLHYPTVLGVDDASKTFQDAAVDLGHANSQSQDSTGEDDAPEKD